jgi:hypothetical protein
LVPHAPASFVGLVTLRRSVISIHTHSLSLCVSLSILDLYISLRVKCGLLAQPAFCTLRRRRYFGREHIGLVASGCRKNIFVALFCGSVLPAYICIISGRVYELGGRPPRVFGRMEEQNICRAARIVSNAQCELDHDEWLFL